MRRLVFFLLLLLKAAALWILILNLMEVDYYPGGLSDRRVVTGPDPETAKSYLPLSFTHGSCTHAGTVVRNEMEFSLVDVDGWYRLLWSGAETYYYEDLAYFLQGMECSTATDPSGRWRLRIEYARSCVEPVPGAIELDYRLSLGACLEDEFGTEDTGLLKFGRRFGGAMRRFETRFAGAALSTPVEVVWTLEAVRVSR